MNKAESAKANLNVRLAAYFCTANDEPSFHVPIILFFGREYLDLSFATTIILYYGIGGLSIFFEVPAGAFADKYGRKLSYLAGICLMAYGLGSWLIQGPIIIYVVGRLVFCVGSAMSSGTIDAMMYEEFHRHDQQKEYLKYKSRTRSAYYGFRLVSMPLGAFLFTLDPKWPVIASVIAIVAAGISAFLVSDNNVVPEEHTTLSLMKETVKSAMANKPIRTLFAAAFFISAFGECFWRLFQPSYAELGLDLGKIGWVYASFSLVAVLSSFAASRVSNGRAVFMAMLISFALVVCLFSLTAAFPIIVVIVAVQFFESGSFSIIEVPVPAYAQQHFEKYQQTTLLSIYSMMFWGGMAFGDVFVAILLAFFSIQTIYIVLAVVAGFIALFFIPKLYRYAKLNPYPVEVETVPKPSIGLTDPGHLG